MTLRRWYARAWDWLLDQFCVIGAAPPSLQHVPVDWQGAEMAGQGLVARANADLDVREEPAPNGSHAVERLIGTTLGRGAEGELALGAPPELVVGNRQVFKQVVLDLVDDGERHFIIDFSRTAYIDSSGLGALLSMSRSVKNSGGTLVLRGFNADLRTLLELTKMDDVLTVVDAPER